VSGLCADAFNPKTILSSFTREQTPPIPDSELEDPSAELFDPVVGEFETDGLETGRGTALPTEEMSFSAAEVEVVDRGSSGACRLPA